MSRVLNLVLSHEVPEKASRLHDWWAHFAAEDELLLAYGGPLECFSDLPFANKVFVPDPRLRTRDHPLERQSYTGVFQRSYDWMRGRDFTHVFFTEFDHLPIAPGIGQRLLDRLAEERADVLAHHLRRIDGTNDPHYLHEASRPGFHSAWEQLSRRRDVRTVLAMMATGSFWTIDAFAAVATRDEPVPIYLEIYLPTLVHHLGFRIRDLTDQNRFVQVWGDHGSQIPQLAAAGAWSVHPVKAIEPKYFNHFDALPEGERRKVLHSA